ncbi:uncharacterized protein [Watersipora subatra]|uniref:uncharacterized protein n=1 Tax=Watersipora subatra TaxID=2589382 RepID=UPI00355BEB8D
MAAQPAAISSMLSSLLVVILHADQAKAQDATYIYIGAVAGGVLLCSVGAYIVKLCMTPESACYKCGCSSPPNAIDDDGNLNTAEYNQLSEGQKKMFDSTGVTIGAGNFRSTVDDVDRSGWHEPPERANQVVEDLHIDMMDEARANERPREHILFTYEPSILDDLRTFRRRLKRERYRVWFDEEQLDERVTDRVGAIAKAIDKAAVIVPVLTEKYEEDSKCRKEIEYADRIKKTLVPVRMQKKYRPSGWLAFLLGNTLFHDLANEGTYQANIDNFLEAMESVGKNAKIADDDFDDN